MQVSDRSRVSRTFFAQMIDRHLNYSTPAAVHFQIVPPFYANAFIMVPSGGALLGLIGWAFVARSLGFDGTRFWTHDRDERKIVAFARPG